MLRLLARSIIVMIAIVKSDAKLGLKLIVLPVFRIEGVAKMGCYKDYNTKIAWAVT